MRLKVIVRVETFVNYAMFSSGARRDPRACREIWKRCFPASAALVPMLLERRSVAGGAESLGKLTLEEWPPLWREMHFFS
jgi:hypothetical protein